MTITYKNGAILAPRTIKTKEVAISLTPDTDPKRDCVLFERGHGNIPATSEVRGPGIKSDTICKRYGIGWYDPQAEPQRGWYR